MIAPMITATLDRKELLALLPFSASTLHRKVEQRTFPQPINPHERGKKYWRSTDVERWLNSHY